MGIFLCKTELLILLVFIQSSRSRYSDDSGIEKLKMWYWNVIFPWACVADEISWKSLQVSDSAVKFCSFGFPLHSRRACGRGSLNKVPVVLHTESFVQPVHKPYITHCQGHRLCSTYKTLYRVAYRSVSRLTAVAHSYPECCPGWRRFHSHNCNQAVCAEACANGGTCFRPNQCACVSGWMGRSCQTDVDECSSSKLCSQTCLNTAGSYLCGCRVGYTLAEDGHSCQTLPASSLPDDSSNNSTGASNTPRGPDADTVNNMTEEVQLLKYKVQLLEEVQLHSDRTVSSYSIRNSLTRASFMRTTPPKLRLNEHRLVGLDRLVFIPQRTLVSSNRTFLNPVLELFLHKKTCFKFLRCGQFFDFSDLLQT
uniref:EGF-like-domain, multiple 7 n=1 Tax=Paramormyrops kingsleyae TaxID=1676925 RepID=A0A3B3R330_9TELE